MSRINIEGNGTGRIEQISSFAFRYAEALCVSFLRLFRSGMYPLIHARTPSASYSVLPRNLVVDGMGIPAEEWVNSLSEITRVRGLQYCTALPLRGVVAARELLSVGRRWCSQCLEEMAETKNVYEPLHWRFTDVECCLSHHRSLTETCPRCHRGEQILSGHARVGCCRHCGAWLGTDRDDTAKPLTEYQIFTAQRCEELISIVQNLAPEEALSSSSEIVAAIQDSFFKGNAASMGRALGVSRRSARDYVTGRQTVPLRILLRTSYVTGASMRELLVSHRFSTARSPVRQVKFQPRRSHKTSFPEINVINDALALAAETGELSVRKVAKELNMNPATLHKRSPALASRLAATHACAVAERSAQRKESFIQKVRKIIKELRSSGNGRPSVNDVRRLINDNGVGFDPWKLTVIKHAIIEEFAEGERMLVRRRDQ